MFGVETEHHPARGETHLTYWLRHQGAKFPDSKLSFIDYKVEIISMNRNISVSVGNYIVQAA